MSIRNRYGKENIDIESFRVHRDIRYKDAQVDITNKSKSDIESIAGFYESIKPRIFVLGALVVIQSLSGIILARFEELLKKHLVVTLFLTMLVGAGGNAGNQSTVNVIQDIASGKIDSRGSWPYVFKILIKEAKIGVGLGTALSILAFLRVFSSGETTIAGVAVSLSIFSIVSASCVIGAFLPLMFARLGFDAAHAGPTIQVCMDIFGVLITCIICSLILG